ncbi:DEAD/DEAH box helicase [Weissella tructae]|uniref:DEAD-box ATP-dependent RNA helicase CshA n=2 Tax=Weissella TaxID=46255 RepID=A0A075U4D3_9LACO|nr:MULTISPECIES: DEAD/DEAH box helicase [Weissella]AIG65002.1 DEAD-box ATP-dependent RNA helicase CshA [Weissella tructae]AIM62314.1 DEAD-box ATP-dependent RNA helicase CshA [Weissella ceti]AIM63653.1 DEAD-box ATP-dependent RNA helicase CshA [Weissella ceti]ELA07806.1 ATP-dependent RNA helicase/autoaggregation-mediating protein [Weissella ceti NC36]
MKFSELGLTKDLLTAIEKHGYEEATPIQEKTIPLTLDGKDVIGQAQTGTGKTAAFGLPILEMIDTTDTKPQALVVSPTRELAIQTQDELFKLGREKRVRVQAVFGGADIRRQINGLQHGAHIVVGTPGRLIDHIRRGTIDLSQVKTLILDEADEMLNMGFLDDIEAILKAVPDQRQTLLFSATMPPAIKRIGVQFMKDPIHVQIEAKELTTDLVEQFYVRVKESEKFDALTRILDVQQPKLAIMFGRTKRRVDELTRGLELRGYKAAGIHGDLTQQKRSQVLKQFKNHELRILVATDVAARGLDVSGVDYVYNFDIPQDPESYVHRIGRTGRAGAEGTSVTFVTSAEMDYLKDIEKLTKKRMTPLKPATYEEAVSGRLGAATDRVEKLVKRANVSLAEEEINNLVEKYDAQTLAAALLGAVADISDMETPVTLSHERPLPRKRGGQGGGRGGYRGGNRNGGRGGDRGGNRREGGRGGYRGGNRNGGRDGGRDGGSRREGGNRNGGSSRREGGNGGQRRSRDFVIRNND